MIAYFAYGTTQHGFPHHRERAALLGAPAGRYRTSRPHAIVVPRAAACSNPGCRFVHRMAMLVPAVDDVFAEGDLFSIAEDALAELDALELSGPYARVTLPVVPVVPVAGGAAVDAVAYLARDPAPWLALVSAGRADALGAYTQELAEDTRLKPCCVADPDHAPPHMVTDPLS